MKKRIVSIVLCLCMILSMLPASASAAEAPVTVTVAGTEDHSMAAGVFDLVNEQREAQKIAPVIRSATLSQLAMQRAAELALYYESSHLRPDDTDCSTVAAGVYTGWTSYGENIAIGQASDEAVMNAWMNSTFHKANILDGNFTQMGVGCFYADGIFCWVQLFGNSTTDTAETDKTGTAAVTRTISVLPANLNLAPTGTQQLKLTEGGSEELSITTKNPGFASITPTLVPLTRDAADAEGIIIATVTAKNDGTVEVVGMNPGKVTVELPVYEGQTDALKLEITVTAPNAPTEPKPTEPSEPTEPKPTDPSAPTEPRPTEPSEPTEPKPTEPSEPTEPDPTDPTEPENTGTWGSLSWKLEGDELTISGKGEMITDTGEDTYPWDRLREEVRSLVIGEGITSIADEAFAYFTELEEVSLPATLERLRYGCFRQCQSLREIELPAKALELGDDCFRGCSGLTRITLPAGITRIPSSFLESTAITGIQIPESVTFIGSRAFYSCSQLESITLPKKLTGLGDSCFEYCALTAITLPEGLKTIGASTFSSSQLSKIVIPASVTEIGDYAFKNCAALSAVIFEGEKLTMGSQCFANCVSLSTIQLPEKLERIPNSAFLGSGLTHIEIPDSVTTIGGYAFKNCVYLKTVVLPENLTRIRTQAFYGCSSLSELILPEKLEIIEDSAFHTTYLKELVIPGSVREIGSSAFADCAVLEKMMIPDSVTVCGEKVFDKCGKLTIHCYNLSHIHLYALAHEIPVVIMKEDPATPVYTITVKIPTGNGAVALSSAASPANRYVLVEVTPKEGFYLEEVFYTCDNDQELPIEVVSDSELMFFMPACNVTLEFHFKGTENPFEDVKPSDYFFQPVLWAVENGITSGVSETRFGPHNPCTRAQVVMFLWRAAGSPEPKSTKNPFTDVKNTDYFYKAVLWAVENGITSGVSDTRFGSNNPCTRAQVVMFLWRTCGSDEPKNTENPFTDVKETDYFYKAVLWAVEYGITSGISATRFGSSNTCTRAHVVTFLYKTVNG